MDILMPFRYVFGLYASVRLFEILYILPTLSMGKTGKIPSERKPAKLGPTYHSLLTFYISQQVINQEIKIWGSKALNTLFCRTALTVQEET